MCVGTKLPWDEIYIPPRPPQEPQVAISLLLGGGGVQVARRLLSNEQQLPAL